MIIGKRGGLAVVVPSAITSAGFVLGVIGVLTFPHVLSVAWLALSLGADVADGAVARAMRADTRHGAALDWAGRS